MIKRTLVLSVCAVVLVMLSGCDNANNTGVNVKSVGDADTRSSEFPAGIWMSDENDWIIKFEPDGTISKFRHHGGMEFVVAEGGLTEQWRGSIEASYGLGPCQAQYDPQTRELTVTIVIGNYIIVFPDGTMEGSFHDHFIGKISEDGTKWNATWVAQSAIIDAGSNKMPPKQLIFTKTPDVETD